MRMPFRRLGFLVVLPFAIPALVGMGSAGGTFPIKTMRHTWSVRVEYPELGNEQVDEGLTDWLNALVEEIMENVKDFADVAESRSSFNVVIDHTVNSSCDDVASVVFQIATLSDGSDAHSVGLEVRNILLSESRLLSFNDIFADPDAALAVFAAQARPGLENYIKDHFPTAEDEECCAILEGEWFDEGTEARRENYDCISLVPEGVLVYFQQHQVLPYQYGLPYFIVPLEKLESAQPNPKIWPELLASN